MATSFGDVPQAPPDAILGVTEAFKASTNPNKLNLGVGAYRDESGKPVVLSAVHIAEERLLADKSADHEYLSMGGLPSFTSAAAKLAFGADSAAITEGRVATIQGLSGTGSLRVGGEFLSRFYPKIKVVLIPTPTWANHGAIFTRAGLEVQQYRYYDPTTRGLDFNGMIEDLKAAPEGAILLLHACAHNPTGVDPTPEQWQSVLEVAKAGKLLPFFDSAYQGFASGDLDRDGAAVRLFADAGLEMLLAQSFAKNMGLYGERVGALSVIVADPAVKEPVLSQLRITARTMYSNPPKHGAAVASIVLNDPELLAKWKEELKGMADRIIAMRNQLKAELIAVNAPGTWDHITNQIGMFSYTGLTPDQVDYMREQHAVFMTRDGRISMAGLSSDKCRYLAEAMADAITRSKMTFPKQQCPEFQTLSSILPLSCRKAVAERVGKDLDTINSRLDQLGLLLPDEGSWKDLYMAPLVTLVQEDSENIMLRMISLKRAFPDMDAVRFVLSVPYSMGMPEKLLINRVEALLVQPSLQALIRANSGSAGGGGVFSSLVQLLKREPWHLYGTFEDARFLVLENLIRTSPVPSLRRIHVDNAKMKLRISENPAVLNQLEFFNSDDGDTSIKLQTNEKERILIIFGLLFDKILGILPSFYDHPRGIYIRAAALDFIETSGPDTLGNIREISACEAANLIIQAILKEFPLEELKEALSMDATVGAHNDTASSQFEVKCALYRMVTERCGMQKEDMKYFSL